jgi:toxin ParE1/3/4
MKVIWTDFASNSLLDIYKFYKEAANENVAQRIKFRIFKATSRLIKHPLSGQIEPNLNILKEDHRYLIEGNYKIIYKKIKEGILITDVFDTRQDPIKIFKSIIKTRNYQGRSDK